MDLDARLMGLFLSELEERLDAFNGDLLMLETQPAGDAQSDLIASLFRGAHSLKGAAGSVGATRIEGVCHALEDLLAAARDKRAALRPPQIQLLFEIADALRDAGASMRSGGQPGGTLAALGPRIRASLKDAQAANDFAPVPNGVVVSPAVVEPPSAYEYAVAEEVEVDEEVAVDDPPAEEAPARQHPGSSGGRDGTVRVDAEKLDQLLKESSELLVANHRSQSRRGDLDELGEMLRRMRAEWSSDRSRVGQREREHLRELDRVLDRIVGALALDRTAIEQASRRVDAEVRRMRMLPFASACEGLDRVVRDAAVVAEKRVRIEVTGGDTELDRSILSGLRDALIHLVRNAVDHGIETPAHRVERGKEETGMISVRAALRGEGVEITVGDDGGGLDLKALRQQVARKGLVLDDDEIPNAVFVPGISTARSVTGLSGRGVGLDAVRAAMSALRGTIEVSSKPSEGTRFVLRLPLTLSTLRVVMFEIGGRRFALDTTIVERVGRVHPEALVSIEGQPYVMDIGQPLPFIPLSAILEVTAENPNAARAVVPVIVVQAGDRRLALSVDAILEEREVVLRGLGPRLGGLSSAAGVTILGDGSIVAVVSTTFLFERAAVVGRRLRTPVAQRGPAAPNKRILLVDDSLTTRTLERSILEAEGYDVIAVGDGEEALQALQETTVDLVISDVDMPRMDGFALVEAIRASGELRDLPVVLVTARESDDDKRRGVEVGADAYVLKSRFDQRDLLETVGGLI